METELSTLLVRCVEDDRDGWQVLRPIIAEVMRGRLRRMLHAGASGPSGADDIEQEFYLFLWSEGWRRLRAFRGSGEAQFRAYIRAVARNFLRSRFDSDDRSRAREADSALAARPEAGGATEPEVLAALREFLASASAADRARLGPGPSRVGPRTLRRWRRAMAASCLGRAP